MLNFVNITEELSYQKKFGIPDEYFGIQFALKDTPLDFQYSASESVSNFQAVQVDSYGEILEINSLSTSLITYASSKHTCTGLVNYSTALDCGVYYFLVNDKFQSDYFRVLGSMTESTTSSVGISISGLNFEDTYFGIPDIEKCGIPVSGFGIQYALKDTPLDFRYTVNESVSSFLAIQVNNIEEILDTITLSNSLITYSGGMHTCTGLVDYISSLDCGTYYYLVNSRYQSDYFQVLPTMEESTTSSIDISISGLNFEDTDFGIPDIEKNGTPFIDFGIQYQRNVTPLDFSYSADEVLSSFVAKRLDNNYKVVETVTIETSLITYASGKHTCTGLVNFVTALDCGHYYYLVNGHYQSDVFAVIDIDDDTVDCLELFGGGTLELFSTDCLEIFA